ncbi:MAG TPA: hypothetical protein VIB11_09255 [Pedococcus sp.]|jgi:hypothetical protein|uniref:hypothetical protein n=1 Tax=Pedococcus sp. TaxID=2860345 RepID=UPI002F92DF15
MAGDPIVGTDLTDGALQDEIELVGELVVVASASKGPLSEEEIDEALGLHAAEHSGREVEPTTPHHGEGHRSAGRAGKRAVHAPPS